MAAEFLKKCSKNYNAICFLRGSFSFQNIFDACYYYINFLVRLFVYSVKKLEWERIDMNDIFFVIRTFLNFKIHLEVFDNSGKSNSRLHE